MKQHIKIFQKTIWDFYKNNKRDLPWRNTTDPYKILISEVMLQQTQISRVLVKYGQWLEEFPDFKTLANSSFKDVLRVWSGLGYNRRALYLHTIAKKAVNEFDGKLPDDPNVLETFPGIGKNTAAAIIVFSKIKPLVFIETNIRRVFIHEFFAKDAGSIQNFRRSHFEHNTHCLEFNEIQRDDNDKQAKKNKQLRTAEQENFRVRPQHLSKLINDNQLFPLIQQTLDTKNPRQWYYALMDYGTYLAKTVENPNRKSAHYSKQSRFDGSIRQVRGQILRVLLEKKKIKIKELELVINSPLFQKALEQLEKEQFILKKSGSVTIREQN